MRQIRSQFQLTTISAKERADNIGIGLRSDAREDLLVDKDVHLCDVTNIRLTQEPEVQQTIVATRAMQKISRQIWNPFGDEVIHTNYMGLVTVDKDATQQNG